MLRIYTAHSIAEINVFPNQMNEKFLFSFDCCFLNILK